MLDSSYQGVKRLFVLAYYNTVGEDQVSNDPFKKYFLPIVKMKITILKLMKQFFTISQLNN